MAWTNEQLQAIHESGTNIIVSAGAGSGKTAVLTTRVLEKLKKGVHINELLILTFTNAAAGEMKDRIKKNIKKEKLLEELTLIDSAYITTFDSFALSIVKKYHYLLNIPKEISITDNTILSLQKEKILTEIFEKYYKENKNECFKELIKDFCIKDDKDLIQEIINLANSIEINSDRDEFLESYIKKYYTKDYQVKLMTKYHQILLEKIDELYQEIKLQSNFFDSDYEQKIKNNLSLLNQEMDLDKLIATIEITKLPPIPKGSDEETKIAKEKINKVLKELQSLVSFGYKDELMTDYQITKTYLEIIIEILKKYFEQLDSWKNKHYAYDFTDIAHLSLKILKEQPQIREELKQQFKEIMVDEYQDTSDIQEEFLSLIGNQNIYMVGDIKQSIYRFRNANPFIFKEKYDKYSKKDSGIKIDLLKNFRSRTEVLENINAIFNPIMTDTIGNANYLESHQMNFGNTAYIEQGLTTQDYNMEILKYDATQKEFSKEEIEIFTIAKDILNKIHNKYQIFDKESSTLRPATWNDFVIIMDRNASFDLTKKIFEYHHIPLSMYKDEEINESIDLYILKNLITLLLALKNKNFNKEFEYAFTSLARSYLYNLNDEKILDYLENKNYFECVIIKDIFPITNIINSSSTLEILEKLLDATKFYEKIILHGDVLDSTIRMEEILKLAKNLGDLNYDIYKFHEYLKELQTKKQKMKFNLGNNAEDSVKIMNIHKSKGLEFPICYFCGLYKTFSKEDLKGNIIYEKSLPIYMPNNKYGSKETFLKILIQDKIKKEDISEKIRLFYVALTRAREKMILILPKKDDLTELKNENGSIVEAIRYKYNSIASMLYSIPKTLKKYTKEIDINSLNLTKDYQLSTQITSNIEKCGEPLIVKEINIKNTIEKKATFSKKINSLLSKEEKRNIELGLKVHKALEFVDFKNLELESIEDSFIKSLINKMLQNELLKDIQEANIYQEYEFIYEEENTEYHGIIDLMLEYKNHIDIIDYKLSSVKDEAYITQLNGYKHYMEKNSKKEIHTYLFSILESKFYKI